jgi:hypothetical protein
MGRLKDAHRHARCIVWTQSMPLSPYPIKFPIILYHLIAFGYFWLRTTVECCLGKGAPARGKVPGGWGQNCSGIYPSVFYSNR